MIALCINCEIKIQSRVACIFDIFFSIMGIAYEVISEENINEEMHSMVITYGDLELSKNLHSFIESGGFAIQIIHHREINRSITESKNRIVTIVKGMWKEQVHSPSVNNESNAHGKKISFYFPFTSFEHNLGQSLYTYEETDQHAIILTELGQGFLINVGVDIISSAFYLLFEDQESGEKSVLEKSSANYFPVNQYVNLIQQLLLLGFRKKGIPLLMKMPWPSGKKFAACLAHDIDWLNKWKLGLYEIWKQILKTRRMLLSFQFKNAIIDFLNVINIVLRRKDISKDIIRVLDLEENSKVVSTFYFFGNMVPQHPFFGDRPYSTIQSAWLINHVSKRRDIGLHGSYHSYRSKKMLLSEKAILEQTLRKEVTGVRQHCQKFDPSITWMIQEHSGFTYDVTRMDTSFCFPFNVFSRINNTKQRLLEIPLTLMDEPLTQYPNRMILSEQRRRFIAQIKKIVDEVNRYNGVVTLLWHPFEKYPGCISAYQEILKYLNQAEAYITSCGELADWWSKRDSVHVIGVKYGQTEVSWRIRADKDVHNIWFQVLGCGASLIVSDRGEVGKKGNEQYVKFAQLKAKETAMIRWTL